MARLNWQNTTGANLSLNGASLTGKKIKCTMTAIVTYTILLLTPSPIQGEKGVRSPCMRSP